MLRIQTEILAPIIQQDACSRHGQLGTEIVKMALDQGDHVPFTVCRAEVNRSATVQINRSGKVCLSCNLCRPLLTVFLTEEVSNICFHVTRIRNIHFSVSEPDLHGFQLFVYRFRIFLGSKR